jgi:Glycosyl hydrolase family 3 C terminal domain.
MYAEAADVTIACVGLDAGLEGEEGDTGNEYFSGDKKDLLIPESQRNLMAVLQKSAKKLVTVVAAGSSLNVQGGNAKLFAWYPGQAGGTALAEIIFGEKNPSGHLPLTFYEDISDLPPFEDYHMENRTYRYFTGRPLYPFGYGLSYTEWSVADAVLSEDGISVNVQNNGHMDGDAVVQVYVRIDSPDAPVHPRLCGFARVSVPAGEKRNTLIHLDRLTDTVVNERGERVKADCLHFYIGMSQPDEQSIRMCGVHPVEISV